MYERYHETDDGNGETSNSNVATVSETNENNGDDTERGDKKDTSEKESISVPEIRLSNTRL